MGEKSQYRRANTFLIMGLTTGIILAAFGISYKSMPKTSVTLPPEVVARVNGEMIRTADFESVLKGVAVAKADTVLLDSAARRQVLDKMIDEELLIQRAMEFGLTRSDGRVRRDLTSAIITSIVLSANAHPPTLENMRTFYNKDSARFANQIYFRVSQVWVSTGSIRPEAQSFDKAREAEQRLVRGESLVSIRSELGDAEPMPIPDRLMPTSEFVLFLEANALETMMGLMPGKISPPIRTIDGFHVLKMIERKTCKKASFEQVLPQVESAYRQQRADSALTKYVKELRERAIIAVRN